MGGKHEDELLRDQGDLGVVHCSLVSMLTEAQVDGLADKHTVSSSRALASFCRLCGSRLRELA